MTTWLTIEAVSGLFGFTPPGKEKIPSRTSAPLRAVSGDNSSPNPDPDDDEEDADYGIDAGFGVKKESR